MAIGPLFSTSKYFFVGLGLVLYRRQTTSNLTQSISPQTPYLLPLAVVWKACLLPLAVVWKAYLLPLAVVWKACLLPLAVVWKAYLLPLAVVGKAYLLPLAVVWKAAVVASAGGVRMLLRFPVAPSFHVSPGEKKQGDKKKRRILAEDARAPSIN